MIAPVPKMQVLRTDRWANTRAEPNSSDICERADAQNASTEPVPHPDFFGGHCFLKLVCQ